MPSPTSFLKDELKQNGIANDAPELIQYETVLTELSYALSPVIHEGKLQPYGFVVIGDRSVPGIKRICDHRTISLEDSRRVADGCNGFSLFKHGHYSGVILLEQAADNELQLVQLQQDFRAVICTTDSNGVTKVFCDTGVLIHQFRSWQRKPSVTVALQNVCRCVPQANPDILRDLLEFCFHDLSSRKIGATLVWCLAEPTAEEMENMQPSFVPAQIEARVGDGRSVALLRHLLTYTDGAAILDPEARTVGIGAQLKYSDQSKRLIEARAGTRHTSAQRFSYDYAKVVVFVVSSDGPVTVFSDGMSVTDLQTYFTDRATVENSEDIAADVEESPCSTVLRCPSCQKRLQIQEGDVIETKVESEDLFCPVCGVLVHSTRCSNLDVFVVKELEGCFNPFMKVVGGRW
ncbi:diadenylate cyclase [Kovacikia minuta CCNUW1]|uniref:diadenylate cyclase n=1 Tax=Kovacikia minuta TaxID=2931930 RepID=UPI001CCC6AAE|nr:diadenylate cyclase [Kovacikia minuta]UBF24752.1 diadenylate cyclase [Kovacikia minuta CCNUW1]